MWPQRQLLTERYSFCYPYSDSFSGPFNCSCSVAHYNAHTLAGLLLTCIQAYVCSFCNYSLTQPYYSIYYAGFTELFQRLLFGILFETLGIWVLIPDKRRRTRNGADPYIQEDDPNEVGGAVSVLATWGCHRFFQIDKITNL